MHTLIKRLFNADESEADVCEGKCVQQHIRDVHAVLPKALGEQ